MKPLETKVISSLDDPRVETDWKNLWQASSNHSMFMTYEWISTMWETYVEQAKNFRLLEMTDPSDGDKVVALIPYAHQEDQLNKLISPQSLIFGLNHLNYPDHLDFLVHPGCEERVAQTLEEWMDEQHWNFASMRSFTADCKVFQHFYENSSRFLSYVEPKTYCPYAELPDDFDEFMKGLKKSFRKKVRYKHRRLQKEYPVEFKMVDEEDELERVFDRFVDIHTERWEKQGEGTSLVDTSRNMDFNRTLCRKTLKTGILRMGYVTCGDTITAVGYDFHVKGVINSYNTGFCQNFGRYSVGNILTMLSIRHYIEEDKAQIYDMLRGPERYKFMWVDRLKNNFRLVLFPPNFKGWLHKMTCQMEGLVRTAVKEWKYRRDAAFREEYESFLRMSLPKEE